MELTEYELDMFNEIGNVGVGNAATALSTMLGKKVNISLPTTKLINREELLKEMDRELLIVTCKIEGDLEGNVVVIYNKENAFPLIDLMNGVPEGTLKELDEMAKSAYKEMVNIIAGPYLDSLSQMMSMRLLPKPPIFNYGKLVAIKDSLLSQLPTGFEEVLYVKAMMSIDGKTIFGDMYVVLGKKSLEKVIGILKKVSC
jgi:chemotaxis protein CheC